jgi:hypothetical protein
MKLQEVLVECTKFIPFVCVCICVHISSVFQICKHNYIISKYKVWTLFPLLLIVKTG